MDQGTLGTATPTRRNQDISSTTALAAGLLDVLGVLEPTSREVGQAVLVQRGHTSGSDACDAIERGRLFLKAHSASSGSGPARPHWRQSWGRVPAEARRL